MTDARLRRDAEKLDAGRIARREFLRRAAVVTGGTAAGLEVLRSMAVAQARPKLRVWLFKSFVTAANDVLARHIELWAKDRNVEVELDWATFGDREQKFVAAIEAGNPPDIAEMNVYGPMRYRPALRDVTKLAGDIAAARGGLLPFAERLMKFEGQAPSGGPLLHDDGVLHPQGHHGGQGPEAAQGVRPRRGRVREEDAGCGEAPLGVRQTLNRSDDGDGFMQNILWDYGGGVWDKDGKPALATASSRKTPRRCSSPLTPSRSTRSSRPASWAGPTCRTTRRTSPASS